MSGIDDPIDMYGSDPADGDRSYEHSLIKAVLADPFAAMDSLRRKDDEIARLRDERDQALIRAEAAEAELDAYRRAEHVEERRAS